jgi:hypothetical protein
MPRRNTYRTNPPRPPTPPLYHPTIPDGYDVEKCGENEYQETLSLEMKFDKFKEDLQEIVTKIVERIEALEERIGHLETRVYE